uniref:Lysozyme n=1 Tax=Panagrolaimus sp. PS1159 TaxID=55785 RepID=A0AC35GTF9_9BILA
MCGTKVTILLLLFINFAETKLQNGFDTSFSAVTVATFKKFKTAGYTFYVQRIGRTNEQVDATGLTNLKNAYDAGFTDVGAYIWPCAHQCKYTASQQVTNVINALQYKNITINTLWLDIEPGYWPIPLNTTYNTKFLNDMANTAESAGYNIGIYTRKPYWEPIMGYHFTDYAQYPLYWNRYTGHADLTNGWENFGGWTQPYSRQWDQNHREFGVDFNPIVK